MLRKVSRSNLKQNLKITKECEEILIKQVDISSSIPKNRIDHRFLTLTNKFLSVHPFKKLRTTGITHLKDVKLLY
jgi:hypothetical protein